MSARTGRESAAGPGEFWRADPGTPPSGRPLPAAVLWDMDGTLVDTEPYWIGAEHALVAEHGGSWTTEHAHNLIGNSLPVSAAYIRRHGKVDLSPERIVEELLDRVVAQVRERTPWRSGARRLLDRLAVAGVPCALVTMSYRRLADAVVAGLPTGTFATLVTGDEVPRGKPHPDPYLMAATRLGVAPGDCVAIEDSPTGVTSAEAAGVMVLAVEHLLPLPDGPGRRVVPGLDGIGPVDLADLLHSRKEAGAPGRP